jgi:hypothetical protein
MTIALVSVIVTLAVLAMVIQFANLLFASLLFAGLGAVVAITDRDGPGTAFAAVLGVALLLAAEFGFWSMEIPFGRRDDVGVITYRLGGIGILAAAGLALAIVTAVIADSPVNGGLLTTGAAAVAALAILVLALVWTRRIRT